jgi:ACR3 family arsenite transporter
MSGALWLLGLVGRNGQYMLVAGLVGGLAFPQSAAYVRPHLAELIVALLFFAALKIAPRQLGAVRKTLPHDLAVLLALQLVLPVLTAGLAITVGWTGPAATMLILIATGSSITGTPPIAQMLGLSAATAMRLLVLGTLLLPLTSIVPLRMAFGADSGINLLEPALRLAGIILLAVGGAAVLRLSVFKHLSERGEEAVGGVTATLLAIFVLALMGAVQPALAVDPLRVAAIFAYVSAICVGLQVATVALYASLPGRGDPGEIGAVGLAAGNRNIALFLAAMPGAQMEPLMVLIGCYQIPMFLTPIIMRPIYRSLLAKRAPKSRP